jgi:guanine deaminase
MLAIRSRILHYTCTSPLQYEYLEDGVLLVAAGKVVDLQAASSLAAAGFDLSRCEHLPESLIIPGLIDTHIHSPQIDVIGSYGKQLLDWLNDYTFPAEAKLADVDYARRVAEEFIQQLLSNGTTTAMVFTTSHEHAAEAVFESAYQRDMRLIAGKVLMDRNAPENLMDTAARGYQESANLIERWHGKGRLGYALTPRFSGTSTDAQLKTVSQLHQQYPDTWIQTHLSENLAELAWLRGICPEAKDYLDTYERFGINDDRTIFAHGIHLSSDELLRLADGGGRIAFCPTSNLFLGSGLLDLQKLKDHGIPVSIASDVGGGTSFSLFRTLSEAYKVCQLQGYSLHPHEAMCLATLGNAEALQLDNKIGNFAMNKEADFVILDPTATDLIKRRVTQTKTIADELFVYITLGDERLVSRTYINGVLQYSQEPSANKEPSASREPSANKEPSAKESH